MKHRFALLVALLAAVAATPAAAQDPAAIAKWSEATIVHYQAVGVISDPNVQIPPVDADLYADVTDRITLSFDWDRERQVIVGEPQVTNHPAEVTNVVGMGGNCPTGSIHGAYEHFDVVEVRSVAGQALELVGKRIHPATSVAESCGAGTREYAGGETPVTEYTVPPDPTMLAFASMLPADGPFKLSPDGRSIVMRALNNNWVWTFTPSVK